MADNNADTSSEKLGWYHPGNLPNAAQRIFNGDFSANNENHQGELIWTLLTGFVVGNSWGTSRTKKNAKRLNLGPVYFF